MDVASLYHPPFTSAALCTQHTPTHREGLFLFLFLLFIIISCKIIIILLFILFLLFLLLSHVTQVGFKFVM